MQQVIVLRSPHRTRNLIALAGLAIAVISFVAIVVLASRWPFSRRAVLRDLEAASLTKVDVGTYHGTYFPVRVAFSNTSPFSTIRKPGRRR
jgi:hypothetical protein